MCISTLELLAGFGAGLAPLDEVDVAFLERGRRAARYRASKRRFDQRPWPCGYGLSRCRGYWRTHFERRFRARTREALQRGEEELFPLRPERYARMVW